MIGRKCVYEDWDGNRVICRFVGFTGNCAVIEHDDRTMQEVDIRHMRFTEPLAEPEQAKLPPWQQAEDDPLVKELRRLNAEIERLRGTQCLAVGKAAETCPAVQTEMHEIERLKAEIERLRGEVLPSRTEAESPTITKWATTAAPDIDQLVGERAQFEAEIELMNGVASINEAEIERLRGWLEYIRACGSGDDATGRALSGEDVPK